MRRMFFGLMSLLLLFIALRVGNGALTVMSNRSDKDLVIIQSHLPENLDPNKNAIFEDALPITAIYEGLVKLNPETLAVEPSLAESWEVSDNGLRWTFHLRPNVYFSDGTECNAETAKASLSRSMVFKDSQPYCSMIFHSVSSIEADGKYSLSFLLKYPYTPFLKNIALPFGAPLVSPKALSKYGDDFWKHPSGTGPYLLGEVKDNQLVLLENPNYRNQPIALKKIIIQSQPDSDSRKDSLLSRKADIIIQPAQKDINALEKQGVKLLSVPGIDVSYLGFYTDKPPFNNKFVRMAVANVLDRNKIVANLLGGDGIPATGLVPPPIVTERKEQEKVSPEQVRRILSREGYPSGIEVTLVTYQEERRYCPVGGTALAEEIKRQLEPAGIKVTIQSRNWNEHKQAIRDKTGNFFLYGWTGDNGDADNFLYTMLSSSQINRGLNTTAFKNNQLDTFLNSAQKVSDPKARDYLYLQSAQIITQETPLSALNHSLIKAAYQPGITNVHISGFGLIDLIAIKKD